jgi:hypothetical protein
VRDKVRRAVAGRPGARARVRPRAAGTLPPRAAQALEHLRASPFFLALPARRQAAMVKAVERIARYGAGAGGFVEAVDFPAFVAALIQGVFQAIVDASVAQMKDYADLLDSVAASVDEFTRQNVSGEQARARLLESHPELFEPAAGCRRPPCLRLRRRRKPR